MDLFRQFWWLIFPIFGFGMAYFRMWRRYRQEQAWLELMKTYAAQGKDPPEALLAKGPPADDGPPWSGRWGYRHGPLGEWRRAIFFGALAVGFWLASLYTVRPEGAHGFQTGALILGVLAVATALMALLSSVMRRPQDPNGR